MGLARLATTIATLGGLGCVPWAPGTWGSAAGLGLGWVCARALGQPASVALLAVAFVIAATICTQAEAALGRHDPPSVILDEVWGMGAIPILLPWITGSPMQMAFAFALFRAFDIAKPPPLKRLARLPRGWGIMADDLGAVLYALVVLWLISRLGGTGWAG